MQMLLKTHIDRADGRSEGAAALCTAAPATAGDPLGKAAAGEPLSATHLDVSPAAPKVAGSLGVSSGCSGPPGAQPRSPPSGDAGRKRNRGSEESEAELQSRRKLLPTAAVHAA